MPETDVLSLGRKIVLPDGLRWPCRHMIIIQTPRLVRDPQGRIYRQNESLSLPNAKSSQMIWRMRLLLPKRRCWGALNTRTMAYWFEPTKTTHSIVADIFELCRSTRVVDTDGVMPSRGIRDRQAQGFVIEDASSAM